jgi:hypothetical protein
MENFFLSHLKEQAEEEIRFLFPVFIQLIVRKKALSDILRQQT